MRLGNAGLSVGLASYLLIWCCAPSAAQEQDQPGLRRLSSSLRYGDQYRAAEALANELGPQAANPETLYQLSRLLSDPCDQMYWLQAQFEQRRFGTDPATRTSAENVLARLDELEAGVGEALKSCAAPLAGLREIVRRVARPPVPWEITDPAQLAETWRDLNPRANADLQRELTTERKLLLNARGIPAGDLGLSGQESWDVPRKVVELLAAAPTLPPMSRLLQLHDALERAASDANTWSSLQYPVDDTVRIARALLDRALGVDAADRPNPVPAPDWSVIATRLEAGGIWWWATLARVLEGAEGRAAAEAANAARTQWDQYSQVAAALGAAAWPAVADADSGWLKRLAGGADQSASNSLPLSADYRAARRAARRKYEGQFLQAAGQNNPEDAFKYIQLAKAADVGRDATIQTVTLGEIETAQQITRAGQLAGLSVFALLEMIAIQPASGPRQYYGMLLNITGWTWNATKYETRLIGPRAAPADLIRGVFDDKYKQLIDLRLLIAFDGPLDDPWFGFERSELLPYANSGPRTGKGWLIYMPSLAAFRAGNWPTDDTLRHCFLASQAAGQTLGMYSRDRAASLDDALTPQKIGDPLEKAPALPLYAFSTGDFPAEISNLRPGGFVGNLYQRKTSGAAPLPVFLVFTSKSAE